MIHTKMIAAFNQTILFELLDVQSFNSSFLNVISACLFLNTMTASCKAVRPKEQYYSFSSLSTLHSYIPLAN
jgi:hypothetical protein